MKNFAAFIIIAYSFSAFSQKDTAKEKTLLEKTSLSGLNFRSIGPALTSGRIADLAVNPNNHNEYYVATASGGVWKTTNHGVNFQPIFDGQNSYSIGCVTMDPHNPHTIWVGTGENNNQRSVAYGDGVYKSEDGGQSWKNMGLKNSEHIGMIVVHPENPQVVFVAAYGPLWSAGGDRGIYKTTDGGENWEKILDVSEHTGFNEIHLDPRDPDVMYAAAHQRRRHVWTYVSGGPESAIYKSTDGGENWKILKNGIPSGDKGRIGLAIPPTNPDRIYAMIEGHGVYRSDNRGASFSKMDDYNTSGNYYVELVPHPTNADVVFSLDTYMHATRDGGKTWQREPRENRHVDDHALWINPENPEQMIVGCDGGLYETYDAGDNWHFKPNLPVTQFYRVAVDNAKPFYNVYGGTQDNFSLGGPSRTINASGIVNSDWFVTNTGDGFETQIDPVDPNIIYAQAQYGWLVRYDKKSGESVGIKPLEKPDEPALTWNWDAPLLISPHDHKTLYFAANKLFKSTDRGSSWTAISEDLTRDIDRHTLPVMGKIQSVDAIAYDRSTSNYGNIVALDESRFEKGLIYVGTDDGLIQVTEDGGETWTEYSEFPNIPENTYIQQVMASPIEKDVVFAVFNNHKNGDFKPYILRSDNRGKSWKNVVGNLPERGTVYSLQQDYQMIDLLFAGTEFGAFFSTDGGENWKKLSGLPTIAVKDMDIQRRENDLVLATFGRGFYILDDYSILREMDKNVLENDNHFFAIKDGLSFIQNHPLGYGDVGFQGASFYSAKNPDNGATFTYYIKEAPRSLKKERQEGEKRIIKETGELKYPPVGKLREEDREEENYLIFVIKDSDNQEIARFTKDWNSGVQRANWDGTYSSVANLNNGKSVKTNPQSANLAPPAKYSVSVFGSENGKVSQIFPDEEFQLNWLENNTLQASDKSALLAFQRETEEVRRDVSALLNYKKDLKDRLWDLKTAVRNTPNTDLNLLDTLRNLELQIADLEITLEGDESLSKRNYDTPTSLKSRLGSVYWNSYGTTGAPTGAQRENLKFVKETYKSSLAEMRQISARADEIQAQLREVGAPYLEGDLPEPPRD